MTESSSEVTEAVENAGRICNPVTEDHFTARFWDERYRNATRVWSGNPNPWLVHEISGLEPGPALDAGCGEGADSHWLAGQGWRVTAVDVSQVALQRGAASTEPDLADRIHWQPVDLLSWVPDRHGYQLVNAQFLHFPPAVREPLMRGLANAVRPGGTLLIVGHHPSDLHTTIGRPAQLDLFYTAEELATGLDPDQWEVLVAEARPRTATDPDGREITIHDTVLHARHSLYRARAEPYQPSQVSDR